MHLPPQPRGEPGARDRQPAEQDQRRYDQEAATDANEAGHDANQQTVGGDLPRCPTRHRLGLQVDRTQHQPGREQHHDRKQAAQARNSRRRDEQDGEQEDIDELKPDIRKRDLRHFYTRLGANFYAIHSLFHNLYGEREDFEAQMLRLVEVMARHDLARNPELRELDRQREEHHNWFLSQEWVGMALYADGFAKDLNGVKNHLPYLQELGVNLLHVMPILKCPKGASDGGYAVRLRRVGEG